MIAALLFFFNQPNESFRHIYLSVNFVKQKACSPIGYSLKLTRSTQIIESPYEKTFCCSFKGRPNLGHEPCLRKKYQ